MTGQIRSVLVEETMFSSHDLSRLTGATYRQVDNWARTGVLDAAIPASGSGSSRQYTLGQVRAAWVVLELGRRGIPPRMLRSCVDRLVEHRTWGGFVAIVEDDVTIAENCLDLVDLIRATSKPVVVLDLDRCPIDTGP